MTDDEILNLASRLVGFRVDSFTDDGLAFRVAIAAGIGINPKETSNSAGFDAHRASARRVILAEAAYRQRCKDRFCL